jgi:hypothetical protein
MDLWCLSCFTGQCVHIGYGQITEHGVQVPVPYAVTVTDGRAFCADCLDKFRQRFQPGHEIWTEPPV